MTRAWPLGLLLCLVFTGCDTNAIVVYAQADASAASGSAGAAGVGGVDASTGASSNDAGSASADAGSVSADAGLSSDAGPNHDAGSLVEDAGSSSDASAPGDGSTPCFTTADCPATWFCSKNECTDAAGSCAPRPLICDANVMPVCGCDHVTYWNTCLREDYGISADKPGECGSSATACMTDADCGASGVTCAHLLLPMSNCSVASPGTCWATPNDCTTGVDIRHWLACPLPPQGTPATCVSTCDAIQSGQAHIQAPRAAQCD